MKRVAQEIDSDAAAELLLPHTMGRGFFFYPEKRRAGSRAYYDTNSDFWNDIFTERVIAERSVTLRGFRIFEWIPRNPGLYHTADAAWARDLAQQFIRSGPLRQYVGGLAAESPDHAAVFRSVTKADDRARQVIYTPAGKVSMLRGGIGCVRLSPIELKRGGQFWFMSATSTRAPDEGIPLLMANDIYQTVIDEIRESGSAPRNLIGRTKFVPEQFRDLYSKAHGIPRIYLEVVDVRPHTKKSKHVGYRVGEVSVAASFLSEYEGYPKIYASYVTFNPGFEGARQSAGRWMREEYIEGLYQGLVLTDFDQQAPSIANTLFSLDQVLTSPDLAKQIATLKKKYGYFDWDMLEKSTLSFLTYEENVMVNVNASGQGNIINIAKFMVDVTNTVNQNVSESAVSEEIRGLLKKLAEQVAAAGPRIDPIIAERMGSDVKALSEEAKSSQPRRKWYEVSLDGLKEAAETVGELGKPILETLASLLPLLLTK